MSRYYTFIDKMRDFYKIVMMKVMMMYIDNEDDDVY